MPISVTGLFRRLTGTPDPPTVPGASAPPLVLGLPLFQTLPGRLFLLTTGLLALLFLADRVVDLPSLVLLFRRVVAFGWLAGALWLAGLAFTRNRRAFLWRVRRKLLLSYVFLGVVPVVLVLAFVLAGGVLVYLAVASYVFREGFADAVDDVRLTAETMAVEIGRDQIAAQAVADRRYTNLAAIYPQLSLAVVRLPRASRQSPAANPGPGPEVVAGPWPHGPPPVEIPVWVAEERGSTSTLIYPDPQSNGAPRLLIRSTARTADGSRLVIADLPVDDVAIERLAGRTGTRIGRLSPTGCGLEPATGQPPAANI